MALSNVFPTLRFAPFFSGQKTLLEIEQENPEHIDHVQDMNYDSLSRHSPPPPPLNSIGDLSLPSQLVSQLSTGAKGAEATRGPGQSMHACMQDNVQKQQQKKSLFGRSLDLKSESVLSQADWPARADLFLLPI